MSDDDTPFIGTYPVRLPIWWGYRGSPGPHPDIDDVSGRTVVLRLPKKLKRLDRWMLRVFGGSPEIRRPLDALNSLLWELSDGSRTFEEICSHLDATFAEDVAPVRARSQAAILQMASLGYMTCLSEPFTGKWSIEPGKDPSGELPELPQDAGLDIG